MMFTTTLSTLLILSTVSWASALVGYDCSNSVGNVATFALYQVGECTVDRNYEAEREYVNVQLLQLTDYESAVVYTCKIRIDRSIVNCGGFSHISPIADGDDTLFPELSNEQCRKIHNDLRYSYQDAVIDKLLMNQTTYSQGTLSGYVDHTSRCIGTIYKRGGVTYEKALVTAKFEITLFQYTASVQREKNVVILKSGTRCDYDKGKCIDFDNTQATWDVAAVSNCNYEKYTMIYDGMVHKMGSGDKKSPIMYYANSTDDIQFALLQKAEIFICGYRMYETDHPQLFVTENPRGSSLTKKIALEPHNIIVTTHFNVKLAYLARSQAIYHDAVYQEMLLQRCNMRRDILQNSLTHIYSKPDLTATLIMGHPGYMAIPAGEVVHLIACQPVECKMRSTKTCQDEIPVTCNKIDTFLRPFSRIMIGSPTHVECNNILPPIINLNGKWMRMSPSAVPTTSPQILTPEKKPEISIMDMSDIITRDLYTDEQIRRFGLIVVQSIERYGALVKISDAMTDRGTSAGYAHISSEYTPNINNLLDADIIKGFVVDLVDGTLHWLMEMDTFVSGVIALWTLWHCAKEVLEMLVHGYTLHTIFGWSLRMFGALSSAVTHLLIHLSRERRGMGLSKTVHDDNKANQQYYYDDQDDDDYNQDDDNHQQNSNENANRYSRT